MDRTTLDLVLYFSDQSVNNNFDYLEILNAASSSAAVRSFQTQCNEALRKEISGLKSEQRKKFRDFLGIEQKIHVNGTEKNPNPIPKGTILCFVQLICLIMHSEHTPSALSRDRRTMAVGLCTGILPAIAAIGAENLIDLEALAVEVLMISFRLELALLEQAEAIEPSDESWAITFSDVDITSVEQELKALWESQNNPSDRRIYVSVTGMNFLTLSGPPSLLVTTTSSMLSLKGKHKVVLPVTGPYHAPHLSPPSFKSILRSSPVLQNNIRPNASVLFTDTGEASNTSMRVDQVLQRALENILLGQSKFDMLPNTLTRHGIFEDTQLLTIGPFTSKRNLFDTSTRHTKELEPDVLMQKLPVQSDKENEAEFFAIVGMAGRFPGADSVEEFWEVLERAKPMHKQIPKDRFEVESHVDPSGSRRNTSLTPWGAFIDNAGLFDNALFNISPKEAPQMDPMHRLILMTTFEALESSGYQKDRTLSTHHSRICTYFGCSSDDWRQSNAGQDIDAHFTPGTNRCFAAGRLNHVFGWEGPSYSVDTACSSSAVAIHLALNGIRSGDCDTAIAGGSNIGSCSDQFAGLSRGGFLSGTGGCKTFLEGADGYCRADAVACVVVKRLEAAKADNDRILAVLRSYASNHSAKAVSLTRPHAPTQEALFRRTLHSGHVEPAQIDYVEMHGTGTLAGDAEESESVSRVFLREALTRKDPFYVGTIKPVVGHSEAASGVSSVIKALQMFRHGAVPPHIINGQKLNPELPDGFAKLLPRKTELLAGGRKTERNRMILINNFNAAGGNTSLLLEEHSNITEKPVDPRTSHVVTVSAKTAKAFKGNLRRLLDFVKTNSNERISNLAYSTTARRTHQKLRKAFVSTTLSDLEGQIEETIPTLESVREESLEMPKMGFVFTGQSEVDPDMGKELFSTSPSFRDSILKSERICQQLGFPSVIRHYFSQTASQGPAPLAASHLALVALEVALLDFWTNVGFKPAVVAGHSLGEYTALYAAQALSLSDLMFVVGMRAKLIDINLKPNTHAMLAIRLSSSKCQELISEQKLQCEIACFNGPASTVVSGLISDIESLEKSLQNQGFKSMKMKLPYAFHSAQMDLILEELGASSRSVHFQETTIPVASGLSGTVLPARTKPTDEFVVKQTRQSVRFQQAIESAMESYGNDGRMVWLELGPRPTCLSMIRSIAQLPTDVLLPSLNRGESAWLTISRSLCHAYEAGVDISWPGFHHDFEQQHLRFLDIPTYSFDLKHYWMQYEGDWMIVKNQRPASTSSTKVHSLRIPSRSLERGVKENITEDTLSLILATDVDTPSFKQIFTGHALLGHPVCSLSVYVDMAYAAVMYASGLLSINHTAQTLQIRDMRAIHPLTCDVEEHSGSIEVSLDHHLKSQDFHVSVENSNSKDSKTLSSCQISTMNAEVCNSKWKKLVHFVSSRTDALHGSTSPSISRLSHELIYKLLEADVSYSQAFRGMDEVLVNSEAYEAVAHVTFKTGTEDAQGWAQCPYWIESLFQVSFLVLNAHPRTPPDSMFVLSGWESLTMPVALQAEEKYRTYVKMYSDGADSGTMTGDVYVLDNSGSMVAVCESLEYKLVKKSIMSRILSLGGAGGPSTAHASGQFQELPQQQVNGTVHVAIPSATPSNFPAVTPKARNVDSLTDSPGRARLQASTSRTSLNVSEPSNGANFTPSQSSSNVTTNGFTVVKSNGDSDAADAMPKRMDDVEADRARTFKQVLADEMGTDVGSIKATTRLSDLGLDSIMGLSATAALRHHGFDLGKGFFLKHAHWRDVEKAVFGSGLSS